MCGLLWTVERYGVAERVAEECRGDAEKMEERNADGDTI